MQRQTAKTSVKAMVGITYVVMIGMNVLANALPINGRTTGGVSDAYENLFAPAGVTFAIWGVIYVLLGAQVLYQLGLFRALMIGGSVDFGSRCRPTHSCVPLSTGPTGPSGAAWNVQSLAQCCPKPGAQLVDGIVLYTGSHAYRLPDGIAIALLALLGP